VIPYFYSLNRSKFALQYVYLKLASDLDEGLNPDKSVFWRFSLKARPSLTPIE
jgi:hypothetical protein